MFYFNNTIIEKIRQGYYSAVYFKRAQEILLAENNLKPVTIQVFQKHDDSLLCGVEEVAALFKSAAGYFDGNKWIDKSGEIKIMSLKDGDSLSGWDTVMHIRGPYAYFAHLESLYLGILARRTLVASNMHKVKQAAGKKAVIFFGDRFDHFINQEGDGFAAHIGGADGVCTPAHVAWWEGQPSGTIPHSLIALNMGDTVAATKQFDKYYGSKTQVITLVDFDNNCVETSLVVARKLQNRLWGVRLDTSQNLLDRSMENHKFYKGVNPVLVKLVREALDKEGFNHVKIIVSGGFDKVKIGWFEEEKAPVDVYGIGSAILHGENDFTADIVEVAGQKIAKVGRKYKPNKKLQRLTI